MKTRAAVCHLILLLSIVGFCATMEKVEILNSALGKKLSAVVVLPSGYASSKNARFPVVYLLHGYNGNYATYHTTLDLRLYADKYRMVLVCPDGNSNSWYLDSPLQKKSQFETYVIKEVITFIDSTFRTIADSSGRAICGTSMGGHGALTLLARNPGVFCCGSSISGILDLTAFPDKWGLQTVIGPYSPENELWTTNSFITLIDRLVGKSGCLFIDCPTSDFALNVNRSAHKKLEERGIEHLYKERPGTHSYSYVVKYLDDHLKFFSECMKRPL